MIVFDVAQREESPYSNSFKKAKIKDSANKIEIAIIPYFFLMSNIF